MAEHAPPIARTAGPAGAEPDRTSREGEARHERLDKRPETQRLAVAERLLNGRPALAAQRRAAAALEEGRGPAPAPVQRPPSPAAGPFGGSGTIQLKKVDPDTPTGWSAPNPETEIAGDADTPTMWAYSLNAQASAPDRGTAMAEMSKVHAAIGKKYTVKVKELANDPKLKNASFISKNTLASYVAAKNDNALKKKHSDPHSLDDFRANPDIDLLDPVSFKLGTRVVDETDKSNTFGLVLDVKFAESATGYVVGVKDDNLDVQDEIESPSPSERAKKKKSSATTARKKGEKGKFDIMHDRGPESVAESLKAMKTTKTVSVFAKGVDAITKFVAEGGRFQAVRAMGTDLSNRTIFYTHLGNGDYRGVSFEALYGNWRDQFEKQYDVEDKTIVAKLASPFEVVKFRKRKVVTVDFNSTSASTTFDAKFSHYDLDASKKVTGVPTNLVAKPPPKPQTSLPQPQPAPSTSAPKTVPTSSSTVVVSNLQQQPAPSSSAPQTAPAPSSTMVVSNLKPQPPPSSSAPKTAMNTKAAAWFPKNYKPPPPKSSSP